MVFRPYLVSHCSGWTETSQTALPPLALQAMQVWLNSVGNEGHFTRDAGTVFRLYLNSHYREWLKRHTFHSLHIGYKQCKFDETRLVMNGTLLARPKQCFVPISPRILAGWPKGHTWHSAPVSYKEGKFGRQQSLMRGNLLLSPKYFLFCIMASIAARWPKPRKF
jgi:hypothetical protein